MLKCIVYKDYIVRGVSWDCTLEFVRMFNCHWMGIDDDDNDSSFRLIRRVHDQI